MYIKVFLLYEDWTRALSWFNPPSDFVANFLKCKWWIVTGVYFKVLVTILRVRSITEKVNTEVREISIYV